MRLGLLFPVVAWLAAACAPAPAPAPPPPAAAPSAPAPAAPVAPAIPEASAARTAQLYGAAKREGKLVLYTTGTTREAEDYKKPFEAKYPGVEVEYFTGTSEDIINRITAEVRAGRYLADLAAMSLESGFGVLVKEALLLKYLSPELVHYPKEAYHAEGLYTFEKYAVYILAYNTQLVSEAEAPRSYQDLLRLQWKGKIAVEAEPYGWFVYMQRWLGREKAIDYFRQLAPLAQLRKGHTTVSELVQAGEFWVTPTAYQHRVQQQMNQGAPIKWVAPKPTFAFASAVGILQRPPHPNAAQLFMDWRLTEEGQQVSVKHQRVPTRNGVFPDPPSLKEGIEYFPPIPEAEELIAKEQKVFRDIFGAF